jgi:hypothetical protein
MVTHGEAIARTATEALRMLWRDDFFNEWKEKGAIVEALSKKGNHFSDPELGMALMRAGHLTRRGKRGHYQYIQKYPFDVVAEEGNRRTGGERK